ncbi:MAG: metallophosphoesterase [Alphaproteobacteria bacterium]|nr:metallophosphoesterase [Alphaproteobacteria bacterium]
MPGPTRQPGPRENDIQRPASGAGGDIVIVHSSDLHVGDVATTQACGGDEVLPLRQVIHAANAVTADLVLLAGDVFEHNRLPDDLLERTARLLGDAGLPVVILPGNHDPATADSVYRRGGMADPDNVSILGVTHGKAVTFPGLELEVWGHAHLDYDDMIPLRSPRPRRTRWQVAMAHGHYETAPDRGAALNPAWLIGRDEIVETGVDYLALGHWNRATRVASGDVAAYYCGSPDLSETVNVVRLRTDGRVAVRRRRLVGKTEI